MANNNMFNTNSAVVQAWVRQINNPEASVTYEDVPDLDNLRDVVATVLENNKLEVEKYV